MECHNTDNSVMECHNGVSSLQVQRSCDLVKDKKVCSNFMDLTRPSEISTASLSKYRDKL